MPYIPVALSAQYLASASPRLALQCPVHGQCQPEAGIPVPSVGPAGRPGAPLASAAQPLEVKIDTRKLENCVEEHPVNKIKLGLGWILV